LQNAESDGQHGHVNRLLILCLILLTPAATLLAVDLPAGGTEIGTGALQASANAKVGKAEAIQPGQRVTITHADEAKSYSAQFTAPIGAAIAKNERVFALIKARVVGDSKVGEVLAKLQLEGAPYTLFGATIGIGLLPEWTELPVTFVATDSISADTAAVGAAVRSQGRDHRSRQRARAEVSRHHRHSDLPQSQADQAHLPGARS